MNMSVLKSITRSRVRISFVVATLASMVFTSSALEAAKDTNGYANYSNSHKYKKCKAPYFERIATFPVFLNTDIDNETVAEIVSATRDGKTLIYTDSALAAIGFVDIRNPYNPQPAGIVELEGEPTSVAVHKRYAITAVVTDDTFTAPEGQLEIVDIYTREVVRRIDLGGQPDAIAISPDGRFAGVIIENERDEDLGDGRPGQPGNPPGKIVIVRLKGSPANWTTRDVSLLGVSDKFPSDPEPEYIDINRFNIAAITMQEDNHIVLLHLPSGRILNDFSAGTVDLTDIDTMEDGVIEMVDSLEDVPREPDAITWIGNWRIATADEGDLDGGSRGFTIFSPQGKIRFSSGNNDDQLMGMIGHYPEERSENKGNEPEGIEYARYGRDRLLFVGSERSSIVSVYKMDRRGQPQFMQVLPTGLGPEGLLALPKRNLFVVANEEDDRGGKFRAGISIYKRKAYEPNYPTIVSLDRPDGSLIAWAALSAFAADPVDSTRAWTVQDSFFNKSRIYEMDVSGAPAYITKEIVIRDTDGIFFDKLLAMEDPDAFPEFDATALVNDDLTINIDPEGLARRVEGGFWVASEGSGTIGDEEDRPILSRNWLFKVNDAGDIEDMISLPGDTDARQRRFGFEGVTSVGSGDDEVLYVCFQREWATDADELGRDPAGYVRIGKYEVGSGEWSFYYYPLDPSESPNGGWVGLSEIVAVGGENFIVIERDNQGGADARIKRIYSFSLEGLTPLPEAALGDVPAFPIISKNLVRDIVPDLEEPNGAVIEKVEGLAVLANGEVIIVTDNDGVDDSNGETQFLNLGVLDID